jgi:hypothetical protein
MVAPASSVVLFENPATPIRRIEAVRMARKYFFIGLSSLSYSNEYSIRLMINMLL